MRGDEDHHRTNNTCCIWLTTAPAERSNKMHISLCQQELPQYKEDSLPSSDFLVVIFLPPSFVFFEYCGRTTSDYGVWGDYLQKLKKSEIYICFFRSISWWECCILCTIGKRKQSQVRLAPQHKWELCEQTPVCSTLLPNECSAYRHWQSW